MKRLTFNRRLVKLFKKLLYVVITLFVLLNIIVIFHAYAFTHYHDAGSFKTTTASEKSKWQIAGDLLFGIKAQKKLNPAPDSTTNLVQLTTSDGIKLQATSTIHPAAKGTVILFHGHGGNRTGLVSQQIFFDSLGFNTLNVDLRAHGNSSGNTCTIGFEEAKDVEAAYKYVSNRGEKNIVLYGVSLGAATITKALADKSITPTCVILDMPFGSLPEAVEGRVRLMKLPRQPLSNLLTFWGGTLHGFWAFDMKPAQYIKQAKCPVLLQWGKQDIRVSEKETREIYNNIPTKKQLVVYQNSGHVNLLENEPALWTSSVSLFLQSCIQGK